MDKQLVVAISGINAVDNPGPGVGVARSLKEDGDLNLKIIGLAYDAMEPGIYLDWLMDKTYIMPYPASGQQQFIERLQYIKHQSGLDFIIPTLDVELPLYIKYADKISQMGIKTFIPTMEQFRLRNKDCLPEIARRIGIKTPKTAVIHSFEGFSQTIKRLRLPLMIKGAFYKAYRAYTSQEAIGFYHRIVAEWGYPVIVQEVVAGDELNVVGVGDGKGFSLGSVGIKKMWITSQGKIWTGVTIKNRHMLEAAEKFTQLYKWQGAFEFECIVAGDDVYLIEINPRFPAWSYFATGVGHNLPSYMIRHVFNLPRLPAADYETGKLYIRYTYEQVTAMRPFQEMITRGEYSHEKIV
ncbi:ATP-grasp domain-containing protein [bacterium]|nr:ATP-grasp domain-containing protein [bacterium]